MKPNQSNQSAGGSYVDSYVPPTAPTSSVAASNQDGAGQNKVSQALEDQNIFFLLGLEKFPDNEKEQFLDELQQVIWEDFLESDVELLITEEEMVEFKKIMGQPNVSDEEVQGQAVEYLEKLIPDLEKIMLEKALELKADLFNEHINEVSRVNQSKPEVQKKIEEVKALVSDEQWRAAGELLNTINV